LELTTPEKVKVCLVGQDPYHEAGQANGLCFSVNRGVLFPPSLKNVFKELVSDIGCPYPKSGDLTHWAEQGVLMLNTVLTVQDGTANSHRNWGWQNFTQAVFAACAKLPQPIVFITWGGQARAFLAGIPISQLPDKGVVFSSHPSPLGARKGNDVVKAFIGSRPFSQTNRLLEQMGSTPIHWELP
jgi:uracil-DNA glycosylase